MKRTSPFAPLAVVALATILAVVQPSAAQAAIFVVDRTDDTNVAAARVCSAAANDCSLRGAITLANNTGGADTISIPAGTYTLTLVNAGGLNEDGNSTGDLDVNDSVTITGAGSATTIIQAGTNTTNGIDKVFGFNPICATPMAFTVSDVTIRFGRNTQPNGASDFSFSGGGLDFCGTGNSGSSFSISNSVVTQNTNTDGYGGGINIDEVAPATSTITITNTVISTNTSKYWGGGINVFGDNGSTTITGSTITNNTTLGTGGAGAQGGGVNIRITNQNDGDSAPVPTVVVGTTPITNNVGVGFGGGVDVAGAGNQDVTINDSTITGNSLNLGSLTDTTGGGLENSNTLGRTTTLKNVLITNNLSKGSGASTGGGITLQTGFLNLGNTTISGNNANSDGGGLRSGGGLATITNSTISANRADHDNNASGTGGAVRISAGTVLLRNTVVDGNFTGLASTVNEIAGTVNLNSSLLGNTTGATITGASNQVNLSARLAPLAANGGPTVGPAGFTAVLQTHALLPGSFALDNGNDTFASGVGLTTDQRGTGFARVLDAADADTTDTVDIGAFEAHPVVEDKPDVAINEDGSLSTSFNVGDSNLTGGLDTITVTSSNLALVPNANINVAGSGGNTVSNSGVSAPTLVITPVGNGFGTTTITVTATDLHNGTTQTMTDTFVLTVNPIADTPSGTGTTTSEDTQSTSGLVLSRNPFDGGEVTHFQITAITNGTLFLNDGTTSIPNNAFITFAQGNAGLKFTPAANLYSPGGFNLAAALNGAGLGLSGPSSVSITVNPVADLPAITAATTNEDTQTTSGLVISRNIADGAEITHFKITGIANGALFQNNGTTPIVNNDFITFAQGNAGLRFTPTANLYTPISTFSFNVAGATSNAGAGLGTTAAPSITVAPIADLPTVTSAATTVNTQTTSGLVISRSLADSTEVTHFKITAITNGSLFQNDGTTPIANNDFIAFAQGNAGLKFTPGAGLSNPGSLFSFDAAGATNNMGAGLGLAATASITVTSPLEPAPSVTGAATTVNTQTTSGLVITTGSGTSTHFKITAITSGTLFQFNGTTPIANNDFITLAQGNAGLKFTPTPGFTGSASFAVAADNGNPGTKLGPATTANVVVGSVVLAGDLVIREFRERGASGTQAADEYVVVHNRTASPITVGALDGSIGFAVAKEPGTLVFTIPNGTVIPARGHFLGANDTNGLTILGVTPDATWSTDIGDGLGLGLFKSATTFTAPHALDAVGFNTPSAAPFVEGTGLPSLAAVNGEYAWVRKAPNGVVQDTNNNLGTGANLGDFTLVAINGAAYNGVQSVLGAPSPTGINTWDTYTGLTISMVEPNVGPNYNPNRIRKTDAPGGGDRLEFRRRIKNNTGAPITSLRLRFTELTTFNSPGYTPGITQADLRPNTSITVAPNIVTSLGPLAPVGLTLVTPPAQAMGGGLNSIITIPGGLANGASIDVNIALRVSRVGAYRFFATVEAQ